MSGTAVAAAPSSFAGPTVQPPPPAPPTKDLAGSSWEHLPPVQQTALTQPDRRGSAERPWGPPAGAAPAPASSNAAARNSRLDDTAVNPCVPAAQPIRSASSRWPGGQPIPLHLTNSTRATLAYEPPKVGPSGVGRVDP